MTHTGRADAAVNGTMTEAAEVGDDSSDGGFDFRLGPDVEAFRAEVRAFLAEHVTDEVIETAHHTGTIHDHGLHKAMADAGLDLRRLAVRVRRPGPFARWR